MTLFKSFLTIVGATHGSSILGGVFGMVVALVSPELVKGMASSSALGSLPRYAAGLGMIWGLFLGTAFMAFSLLIAALVRLTKTLDAGRSRNRATGSEP